MVLNEDVTSRHADDGLPGHMRTRLAVRGYSWITFLTCLGVLLVVSCGRGVLVYSSLLGRAVGAAFAVVGAATIAFLADRTVVGASLACHPAPVLRYRTRLGSKSAAAPVVGTTLRWLLAAGVPMPEKRLFFHVQYPDGRVLEVGVAAAISPRRRAELAELHATIARLVEVEGPAGSSSGARNAGAGPKRWY
jgi:hypothetical protein